MTLLVIIKMVMIMKSIDNAGLRPNYLDYTPHALSHHIGPFWSLKPDNAPKIGAALWSRQGGWASLLPPSLAFSQQPAEPFGHYRPGFVVLTPGSGPASGSPAARGVLVCFGLSETSCAPFGRCYYLAAGCRRQLTAACRRQLPQCNELADVRVCFGGFNPAL